MPAGNGTVGALMYGQIRNDRILLNHDRLYYPKPKAEIVDVADLLPALPDKRPAGRVTGIACRGQITVDMAWDTEKGSFCATLASKSDQSVLIRLPSETEDVTFAPDAAAAPSTEHGPGYWNVTLDKGEPLRISI